MQSKLRQNNARVLAVQSATVGRLAGRGGLDPRLTNVSKNLTNVGRKPLSISKSIKENFLCLLGEGIVRVCVWVL